MRVFNTCNMFYDQRLMCSKSLGVAWKAANMKISDENEVNVPKICNKLRKWINSDEEDVQKRFSLRTSAIFLGGAVKLYKRGVQQMLEDAHTLDKEMSRKRRRFEHTSETEFSSGTSFSSSGPTPEVVIDPSHSHSRELSPILPTRRKRISNDTSNHSSFIEEEYETENQSINHSINTDISTRRTPTRDQGVQTLFTTSRRYSNSNSPNKNLSFAYIFVHDDNKSKMPSKIIFSSINTEMRNLI